MTIAYILSVLAIAFATVIGLVKFVAAQSSEGGLRSEDCEDHPFQDDGVHGVGDSTASNASFDTTKPHDGSAHHHGHHDATSADASHDYGAYDAGGSHDGGFDGGGHH